MATKPGADDKTQGGAPQLDAATLEQIAQLRTRLHATFGQVVLAMTAVPRYRHQSLADLTHLVLEPLMRDRIAIAMPKSEGEADPGGGALAGIAVWATVSEEVEAKIREQIKAGAFPVRLKAEDWTSGDRTWLLDVIAPNQKLATSVLANFKQVVKEGNVRIHPLVARLVDPELLKRMGAVADTPAAPTNGADAGGAGKTSS